MKLIAHRGLMYGPNKKLENNPEEILKAIDLGFDCEIDLWFTNDQLFLGHDQAQYEIKEEYLYSNKSELWIHAKNIEALYWLCSTELTFFWHQEDNFTLTSNNYIWTYPNQKLTSKSICVMPELFVSNYEEMLKLNCFGICSDYVYNIKNSYLQNERLSLNINLTKNILTSV